MTTSLLISPHNDDAALWASFVCHAERPHVITVLRSVVQETLGITAAEREAEDRAAMAILGCSHEQWHYSDEAPAWALIRTDLDDIARMTQPEVVYAPWPEPGGHDQHNQLGELAREVFGDERCRFYTTYRYGGPRTVGPVEVEPTREANLAKLEALACYRSQILRGPSRFWLMPLNEYLAA